METTAEPDLVIRALRVRAVDAPLPRPLVTAAGTIATAPLVLLDLEMDGDVVGHSYVFVYTSIAQRPVAELLNNLAPLLIGTPGAPAAVEKRLSERFRLLGTDGLVGAALAALDMAAWDALARAASMPLVRLLGGVARPLRAYNSCGMNGPEGAARDAEDTLAAGFRAMKMKIGYPELAGDLAAIRAARRAWGPETSAGMSLMVDYNQSLSVPEAVRRCHVLDDEGLTWIEEPTRAEDLEGHAQIAAQVRTPIQIGENWWGAGAMARSLAVHASDLAMPDLMKIGGVTGWLRASALAAAARVPVSSHIFAEVSAHLLAVTPTADWLEWLDTAGPLLRDPLRAKDGFVVPSSAPGAGIEWNEEVVERHVV